MSEKTGHGVLIDAQGRRYEFTSVARPSATALRWPSPGAGWSSLDARTRLRCAYGLLFATALGAFVAVARARRRFLA